MSDSQHNTSACRGHNHKVEGSNPDAGTGRGKMAGKGLKQGLLLQVRIAPVLATQNLLE